MSAKSSLLLCRLLAASAGLLVALWLLEISGLAELHPLSRTVVVLALAAGVALLAVRGWQLARSPAGPGRRRRLVLVTFLGATFVLRFMGLDYELLETSFGDEGVFHKVADRINNGSPIPATFQYGHFLYYAGAFLLWIFELFPAAITGLADLFYTPIEGYGVQRLLLNGLNALLSTLVTGAVFGIAYRVADRGGGSGAGPGAGPGGNHGKGTPLGVGPLPAAGLAAALVTFSPLYNGISHELIADVPASAFAAISLYFLSRLLDREATRDYLLAGGAAGLAAASKYPAGVVALAIFVVWAYWRIRLRNWSWALVGAAGVSIATLLVVMPGFFVYPEAAFSGEGKTDLLLGFRQYARGGWLGVQPDSNLGWYAGELLSSFGWPAALLALGGLACLSGVQRRRFLLMAAFPAGYLGLIFSMSMVVRRNLQTALPAVAVLVGVAAAAAIARLAKKRRALAAVLAVVTLALPVWRTTAWTFSRTQPSTRQLAAEWIQANIPEGASVIRERYTPELDEERYQVLGKRFAAWVEPDEVFSGDWDFVVLAQPSYARFLSRELESTHHQEYRQRYRDLLALPQAAEFAPSALRGGPLLSVRRIVKVPQTYRRVAEFGPSDVTFVSHHDLLRDGPGAPLQYTRRWQFAVFKEFMAAGCYRVGFEMAPPPDEGYLHVIDSNHQEVGTFELPGEIELSLPEDEKYLFRVFLAPPTRLQGFTVSEAVDSR